MEYHIDINDGKKIHKINLTKRLFDGKLRICIRITQNMVNQDKYLTSWSENMNLYYELLQYPVFSMKEVNALYSSERTARAALGKLLKENMVLKIRNGLYTCVSGENGGPVANRFQVASAITPSSYLSHHTAFEYYGTIDQVFYEVYVGSETRFHDFEFDGYTYHYVKEQMKQGIVSMEFSGGVRVTDKERTIVDSIKDINLIAGLEEVLSCVVSVNSIDEAKMLKYLAGYDSAFLYQKIGFIFSEYQTELGISDDFIKICNERSGNSKRYLTNGISEPGYSGEWKLVYPKNIKQMKNGGIEDAAL